MALAAVSEVEQALIGDCFERREVRRAWCIVGGARYAIRGGPWRTVADRGGPWQAEARSLTCTFRAARDLEGVKVLAVLGYGLHHIVINLRTNVGINRGGSEY